MKERAELTCDRLQEYDLGLPRATFACEASVRRVVRSNVLLACLMELRITIALCFNFTMLEKWHLRHHRITRVYKGDFEKLFLKILQLGDKRAYSIRIACRIP